MVGRLAYFELTAHFAEFFSSSKFLTGIAKFFDDLFWGMSFSFHTRGNLLPLVTQPRWLSESLREKYRYRPILAESSSDPQCHEGTIYRAPSWAQLDFAEDSDTWRAGATLI